MDFRLHYTQEQEEFRAEVKAWLQDNYPPGLKPTHMDEMTEEIDRLLREFRLRLGKKGWLVPRYPREYGGGGLSKDQAIVLDEEIWELDLPISSDLGIPMVAPALMAWGTDEQKQRLLPPILRGEVTTWQCFTEPEAGSDAANQKTTAIREEDHYTVNGQKVMVGDFGDVDFLYIMAVTDRSAPRHHNLGVFLVPADLPGITIENMEILTGGTKRQIFFDNVRVPASQRIGEENNGWQVSQTTMDVEHGAGLGGWGRFGQRDRLVDGLLDYCREAKRNGHPLSSDPDIQSILVDVYIESEVERLLGLRNWWMLNSGAPMTHEGLQYWLMEKLRWPRLAGHILRILGPYAVTTDPRWRPLQGALEHYQRLRFIIHAGGTAEVLKVIMARILGIGRVKW
jgi:alkylation response protein AidB-like acyl-CoA dehydrogenase